MLRVSRDRIFKIVFVIILAAFCVGVVELMALRFKIGDVYPAYSSLRTDPLGTKAYLESLDRLPKVSAKRNLKNLTELEGAQGSTVFLLGMRDRMLFYMNDAQVDTVESLAASGSRVVVTLYPEMSLSRFDRKEREHAEDSGNAEDVDNKEGVEGQEQEEFEEPAETPTEGEGNNKQSIDKKGLDKKDIFADSPVAKGLRFSIETREMDEGSGLATQASELSAHSGEGLPALLSWHSDIYFKDLGDNWVVVYELEGVPVLIERKHGSGSIVLATDSFFVSNEAMLTDRQPQLLAWLVGENDLVVFDETHLGIGERPGIVSLMREYKLQGLIAGVLVLAVLFVWMNSSSLVPPTEEAAPLQRGESSQKDYGSGVVSLLRRNVSSASLLSRCVEEWRNAFPKKYKRMTQEVGKVRKILESENKLPSGKRDSVKAYRKITKILSERKSI